METLNNIILIGVFLSALGNLVIEVDETRDTKYIVIAKFLFASLAIGSILAALRPYIGYYIIYNISVLSCLIIRIIRSLNKNKRK